MPTVEQVREMEREITAQFRQADLSAAVAQLQSAIPSTKSPAPNSQTHGGNRFRNAMYFADKKGRKSAAMRVPAELPPMSAAAINFIMRAHANAQFRALIHDLADM